MNMKLQARTLCVVLLACMALPAHAEWVHRRTADLAVHGAGVYLGDTDFTRRQDRFLSDSAYRRLGEIRAARDPAGRFASYLSCDLAGLNVHG